MVSYVITHRGTNKDRILNLSTVLRWLSNFKFQVFVVEEDVEPKIESLVKEYGFNYIFAFNDLLFNKSWGINIALRRSSEDIIFCGDNDMIIPVNGFKKALSAFSSELDSFKPYDQLIDLSKIQNYIYKKHEKIILFPSNKRKNACFCSGIIGFTRNCLEDIGGWDERFEAWGGEDDAITVKLNKFGKKYRNYNQNCYHLYHARTKFDTCKHSTYQYNKKILNELINCSTNDIKKGFDHLGDINKYRRK